MRELYLDCSMGAAGDMLSSALFELCGDPAGTAAALNAMGIPGIVYTAERVESCGVSGTHMKVEFHGEEERPDAEPHGGHHHHHDLNDILSLLDSLKIGEKVREDAKAVYRLIAEAEGQVHGREMTNIHFHELGTMDAVADITAVCFLMSLLSPERVSVSPVRCGYGSVRCAHGVMPVPAPAATLLLRGIPIYPGDIAGELCTPTGAALLRHFAQEYGPMPNMTLSSCGYGMGSKVFDRPNCVRAMLGESAEAMVELCCNVDDMTPEDVGFAIDELFRAGAPDAYYECIGMKKNRPGVMLTCLCRQEQRDAMLGLIFKHTTTIGIRETLCRRYVLKRENRILETEYGRLRLKSSSGYGVQRKKAEFEDLARISRDAELSLEQVRALADKAFDA